MGGYEAQFEVVFPGQVGLPLHQVIVPLTAMVLDVDLHVLGFAGDVDDPVLDDQLNDQRQQGAPFFLINWKRIFLFFSTWSAGHRHLFPRPASCPVRSLG